MFSVNHLNSRSESALLCAINLNQTFLVWLSLHPWDVHYQTDTFVYSNQDNVSEAIIELLLAQPGIDVDLSDINGYSPLHYAVFHGQSRVVKKPLEHGGVRVDVTGKQMVSTRLTRLLKSHKVNFKFKSHCAYSAMDKKWFPLYHAAMHSLLAQLSERSDAEVGLEDATDESPLAIAAKQGAQKS